MHVTRTDSALHSDCTIEIVGTLSIYPLVYTALINVITTYGHDCWYHLLRVQFVRRNILKMTEDINYVL